MASIRSRGYCGAAVHRALDHRPDGFPALSHSSRRWSTPLPNTASCRRPGSSGSQLRRHGQPRTRCSSRRSRPRSTTCCSRCRSSSSLPSPSPWLLNMQLRLINFFRTLHYLPSILGGSVAISMLWRVLFMRGGVVNALLGFVGIPAVNWLGDPNVSMFTISLLQVWQFGSSMVVFLAGLKQIPRELYESARVDGAGRVSRVPADHDPPAHAHDLLQPDHADDQRASSTSPGHSHHQRRPAATPPTSTR